MQSRLKIALLCCGLGHILRGHEVFARDLFTLLGDEVDITLFKGAGEPAPRERVVDNVARNAACLDQVHVAVSPKWAASVQASERTRIEAETFAYGALKPLLEGDFDVIHCLEQEVCHIIYAQRHLFRRTPKILFSNGGALAARDLPPCDFVQEYTEHNLAFSAPHKAFMIPHGVDLQRFHPGVAASDFRARHGIPAQAFVVISVGTIGYVHKRMDYVIQEVAALPEAYLLVVGQPCEDTPAIQALGQRLMGARAVFTSLAHHELAQAYASADVFTLGSLFETFGIVYIEAMAMGLPVICSQHVNQRHIVKEGIFIDMQRPGALTQALRQTDRQTLAALGQRGLQVVRQHYDLASLKHDYLMRYQRMANAPSSLPTYSLRHKLGANAGQALRQLRRLVQGQAG